MIKIKKEKILVRPRDLKPLSELTEIIGTTNPAAARLPNSNIVLYVRVIEKLKNFEDGNFLYSPRFEGEDRPKLVLDKFSKKEIVSKSDMSFFFKDGTKRLIYISYLKRVVLDKAGFNVKFIEKGISFPCLSWDGELGIEDARIVKIGKLYVMTYVSLSKEANISTSIAISNDCKKWFRRGIIFEEQNKDVVIFPELFDGRYVALNRPEGGFEFSSPHIWISSSKDLESWGSSRPFVLSERGKWDSETSRFASRSSNLDGAQELKHSSWEVLDRIGAGPPPLRTEKGWLFLYHGVKMKKIREIFPFNIIKKILGIETRRESYSVGAVLLELKNPGKIIAKAESPIISPRLGTEKKNIVKKEVVFPTGLVWDVNGEDLLIFSGGGDEVVSVKKVGVGEIFEKMGKID